MGFIFPLFLIAGLAALIPIVIHLVNLRRYKQELFPNIRFLKKLQVVSKRPSKVRKRWLLLMRILFILSLILAFAQPFWKKNASNNAPLSNVSVIYIDNSFSMTAQSEGKTLLSLAKNDALQLVNESPSDARFVILSNTDLYYSSPVDKHLAQIGIGAITPSAQKTTIKDLKNALAISTSFVQNQTLPVYVFSDFQASTLKSGFGLTDSLPRINFYLFPVQAKNSENVFIDSVTLQDSELRGNTSNKLIATIARNNKEKELTTNVRLWINGQTQLVKSITFQQGNNYLSDTLPIFIEPNKWTKAELTVEDAPVSFDDTFRLVVKKPSGFSVLILARGKKVSPYLQAAFNSMPDVIQKIADPINLSGLDWNTFSLVVVQNGEDGNPIVDSALKSVLATGGNILFFPGQSVEQTAANNCLNRLAKIQLGTLDTSREQVVTLQRDHPLLAGIFASIPDQIQLPVANSHFPITAALSANQQDIMSFPDGSPLLTSFNFDEGKLFLCTAPLDGESSNFPLSYFFAPVLFKMTIPVDALQQYSITIGNDNPIWISGNIHNGNHQIWHLYGSEEDFIPPQKTGGRGLAISVGQVVHQTGFYHLIQEGNEQDSIWVAVNANPLESLLAPATKEDIEKAFTPQKIIWLNAQKIQNEGWVASSEPFPLWKLAIAIALFCLLMETLLLLLPGVKPKNLS